MLFINYFGWWVKKALQYWLHMNHMFDNLFTKGLYELLQWLQYDFVVVCLIFGHLETPAFISCWALICVVSLCSLAGQIKMCQTFMWITDKLHMAETGDLNFNITKKPFFLQHSKNSPPVVQTRNKMKCFNVNNPSWLAIGFLHSK